MNIPATKCGNKLLVKCPNCKEIHQHSGGLNNNYGHRNSHCNKLLNCPFSYNLIKANKNQKIKIDCDNCYKDNIILSCDYYIEKYINKIKNLTEIIEDLNINFEKYKDEYYKNKDIENEYYKNKDSDNEDSENEDSDNEDSENEDSEEEDSEEEDSEEEDIFNSENKIECNNCYKNEIINYRKNYLYELKSKKNNLYREYKRKNKYY